MTAVHNANADIMPSKVCSKKIEIGDFSGIPIEETIFLVKNFRSEYIS